MSAQQKLSKKQKKALAFRERKRKPKGIPDRDGGDVPIDENQDLAEMEIAEMEVEKDVIHSKAQDRVDKNKHKATPELGQNSKKREREDDEEVQKPAKKQKKKAKATTGGKIDSAEGDDDDEDASGSMKKNIKQKFILFIGNLRYATSKQTIISHFSACDPPPIVRLPTPKAAQPTSKSKGYAFLEFTEKNALQAALKLHHSELEGRKINVELTAGGGGKSERRLNKVKERNRGLHEQRKRRIEKHKTPVTGDADKLKELERPQRYSATSGIGQAPSNRKTWTIAESGGETRSSGSKNSRKRIPRLRDRGTGVNAIPVY